MTMVNAVARLGMEGLELICICMVVVVVVVINSEHDVFRLWCHSFVVPVLLVAAQL